MKKYIGYQCEDYYEWREILKLKLNTAKNFEVHCWNDEKEWIKLIMEYGKIIDSDWSGIVVKGRITSAFTNMILGIGEPIDKENYNKFTPFFSIFLDNGFSSEHYGTELNEE